jgi:Flp pilus assembly protein TadG
MTRPMGTEMKRLLPLRSMASDERGVAAILVALVILVLLGFAALAIDIGHLFAVRNELQNAADAGALAGARFLYNDDGTAVNTGANQIGYDAATANVSDTGSGSEVAVEVNWTGGNSGDVQRGHWSFADHTFTPNDSTAPVDLWNVSDEELDADLNFINAVKVVTRRAGTPVVSLFARIFGHQDFQLSADAVAYIGFAGTLLPYDVDQPIAICEESILNDGDEYTCTVGRMINSGQNVATHETGGWTSFSQDDACTGGTNAQEVKDLVCGDGNPEPIMLGKAMATNGGDIQSAFNQLIQCWEAATGKTQPWNVTLPVISCPSNNVGTCEELQGAVNLNIIWITEAGEDPSYSNVPTQMAGVGDILDWSPDIPDGQERWADFAQHFNLQNVPDGASAPYVKKSIYFLPDCTPHEPAGVSGGHDFGVLAEIPVLVE